MPNSGIKHYEDVMSTFLNDATVTYLICTLLLEQNDEQAVQRASCVNLETSAPLSGAAAITLPLLTARSGNQGRPGLLLLHHT